MEMTTMIGIVIAIIIMLVGIKLLFKKPADTAPSLDAELHIDPDSQIPVIPRHVRAQLSDAEQRQEPSLNTETAVAEKANDSDIQEEKVTPVEATVTTQPETVTLETPKVETQKVVETTPAKVTEPEFSLNSNIEKAEIPEFEDESSILDAHLHEQQMVDDASALRNAETILSLTVVPQGRLLSGEKTLKILLKYGLRFGEMACFHRYSEDGSKLLFSVLQTTETGMDGFDLETLSTEEVKGLAFFLALPHSDVQNAFDTMDSIARLIAREVDGIVYDQNGQELTQQMREFWRHQAIDYRAGQPEEV